MIMIKKVIFLISKTYTNLSQIGSFEGYYITPPHRLYNNKKPNFYI